MRKFILLAFAAFMIVNISQSNAQSEGKRLAFGFNFGLVKYWGEFTDNQFWFAGDLFLRYNIIPNLSVQASFNLGEMRYKNDGDKLNEHPGYYGEGAELGGPYPGFSAAGKPSIQEKNTVRLSSYEVFFTGNLFADESFVPYGFIGAGLLDFEPKSGDTGYDGPLPNNIDKEYDKQTFIIPVGFGFEAYVTDDFVINGRGTYRFTGTDWLDDYDGDSGDDQYITFGLGLSYYILGIADYDKDGLTNEDEEKRGTDPRNPDTDGDGLKDGEEVMTYYTDPLKADTDGDNLTDYAEVTEHKTSPVKPDTDADGLSDGQEISRKTNPIEADSDGDGLLDGDEVNTHLTGPLNKDTDNDGLSDGDEIQKYSTNPKAADTDNDGLSDGEEINEFKTNPKLADSDDDKLNDGLEIKQYKTNPMLADTDKDGLLDGAEILEHSTNPLNSDSDGDKLNDRDEVVKYKTDPLDKDTDKDNLEDGQEVNETRTDPKNPDTDGDSIFDDIDDCPLIKGKRSKEKGKNGCPQPPKIGTKTDFPDILFIVNTDNFNFENPKTALNLAKMLEYVNQCEGLQVLIEGHASQEGNPKRNQELSEMRAEKVKRWLLEQGVNEDNIAGTVGFGSNQPKISEPTGKALRKISKEELENIRKQNRRITIKVVRTCGR